MDKDTIHEHYANIQRTLIIILALNWAVALAKMLYGLATGCSSMTADGFHSLADGASNIIGIIGIHFACRPRDLDHPYGHRKYETFFSLCIAMMLFLAAYQLVEEGIRRITHPLQPRIDLMSFIVMLATMAVNIAVARYEYRRGKTLQSDILTADALHTKSDILTSISVIAALIGVKAGYPIIDPIATILIALFIAYAGFEIVKESSDVLCDTAVIPEVNKIARVVLSVYGVKTCHKIRTRGRADDIHVDLHVQVHHNMHIGRAHKVSDDIEETLKNAFPGITDVVVHMEPE